MTVEQVLRRLAANQRRLPPSTLKFYRRGYMNALSDVAALHDLPGLARVLASGAMIALPCTELGHHFVDVGDDWEGNIVYRCAFCDQFEHDIKPDPA